MGADNPGVTYLFFSEWSWWCKTRRRRMLFVYIDLIHSLVLRDREGEREGEKPIAFSSFSSSSLSLDERKGERAREREKKRNECSLWNEISLNKLLYFLSTYFNTCRKWEECVYSSEENLISIRGKIKQRHISLNQMVRSIAYFSLFFFDIFISFFLMNHWSSEQLFEILSDFEDEKQKKCTFNWS